MTDGKGLEVKWLRLPVSFWNEEGGDFAEMNSGDGYEHIYEVVDLVKYSNGSYMTHERMGHIWPMSAPYDVSMKEIRKWEDEGGLQGGLSTHFFRLM